MGSFKSVIGLLRAVVPVAYCGGLIWYFLDHSGSIEDATAIGLGPTMLGLAVVGLLFSIPLFVKFSWFVGVLRTPRARSDAPPDDDGFDADAMIARYKARQSVEPVAAPALPPPAPKSPHRRGFGRRTR